MSSRRRAICAVVLAAIFLVVPTAQAAPTSKAPAQQQVAQLNAWLHGFGQGQPMSGPMMESGGGGQFQLLALGDANGDYHGDLVVVRVDMRMNGTTPDPRTYVSALSGADLKTTLWSQAAANGTMVMLGPDANGDGVADMLLGTMPTGSFDSTSTLPVPLFLAESSDMRFASNATVASGTDFHRLARLSNGFSFHDSGLFAPAPFGAAGAFQDSISQISTTMLQADQVLRSQFSVHDTCLDAYAAVVGGAACQSTAALNLSFASLDGTERAHIVRNNPDMQSIAFQPLELSGGGLRDVLILEAKPVLPRGLMVGTSEADVLGMLGAAPVLSAFDGDSGRVLWSRERAAVNGGAQLLPTPGDLDGDGRQEIQILEVSSEPQSPFHLRTTVLSGADGSVLGSSDSTENFTVLLPFSALDGKKAGALRLDTGQRGNFTISLTHADMKPVWSLGAKNTKPLNLQLNPYTGEPTGFADLTGDGVPDIALIVMQERHATSEIMAPAMRSDTTGPGGPPLPGVDPMGQVAGGKLEVLDGRDGNVVWQRSLADVMDVGLVPDLSGKGTQDLVLVRLQAPGGDAQAKLSESTLLYETVLGQSGSTLRQQVLRSPEHNPLPDSGLLQARARALGDLDGDGSDDLGIWVATAQRGAVAQVGGSSRSIGDASSETWMLFSGLTGNALGAFDSRAAPDRPIAATPLDVLPASDAVTHKAGAASAGLILLSIVGAMAAASRRRR